MAKDRRHLRELDQLLEHLELLNLHDAPALPLALRVRLEAQGIAMDAGSTYSDLIERVWAIQERYTAPEHGPSLTTKRAAPTG